MKNKNLNTKNVSSEQKGFEQTAAEYSQKRSRKSIWKRVVLILSAIVVFYTTYMLILPAITMSEDKVAICGMEEHKHDESCYEEQHVVSFTCADGIHRHTDVCYDADGNCACGFADYVIHEHTDECYNNGELVCPLPEVKEHTHTDECYKTEDVLVCELEESEANEESEGHTHTEECYQAVTSLVCGREETEYSENVTEAAFHEHTDACYDENGHLVCGHVEILRHTHAGCRTENVENVLICEKPEHEHDMACLPRNPDKDRAVYYCGYAYEHTHDASCYKNGVLSCNLSEHTHSAECLSNKTVDTETEDDWKKTFKDVKLSGNAAQDILAIAKTQKGYKESVQNFKSTDEDKNNGYTRYGAWYGDVYGDWDAMFCSFCINYANVTGYPLNSSCSAWITDLKKEDLFFEAEDYEPVPGDIVFFEFIEKEDETDTESSDIDASPVYTAAIVEEYNKDAKGREVLLKVIGGDIDNEVKEKEYTIEDIRIGGFGKTADAGEKAEADVPSGKADKVSVNFEFDGDKIYFNADLSEVNAEAYTWQWQVSDDGVTGWTDIEGETNTYLVIDNTTENASKFYRIEGTEKKVGSADGVSKKNNVITDILGSLFGTVASASSVGGGTIVSAPVSPLLGAASTGTYWKRVTSTTDLTTDGVYMIVAKNTNEVLRLDGTSDESTTSDLTAVTGHSGYYHSDLDNTHWFTMSANGSPSMQHNVSNPSYGIYTGSNVSGYGVLSSGHETSNSLTFTNNAWRISRTSGYNSTTYYLAYNNGYTVENSATNADMYIYMQVDDPTVNDQQYTGPRWKEVTDASELTADGKYIIVSDTNDRAIGCSGSGVSSAASDLAPISGMDGYYTSSLGEQYQWTLSADGTSSKQMNAAYPSYGLYAGSSTSYGVVSSGHETQNTIARSGDSWQIYRASQYASGTYYVAASGDSFGLSTSTANSNLHIYKYYPGEGGDDPGDDPGTHGGEEYEGGTVVKPTYPAYVPTSGSKSGTTSVGEVQGDYYSDPATSQLENDRYFSGRSSDDGKVLTDKSVIYGKDDYGVFSNYPANTFGVELSALGQDYAITDELNVQTPLDVVFVLDTSGSMIDTKYNGERSSNIMIESLNKIMKAVQDQNEDNRVGVVCYSGSAQKLLDLGRYTATNDKYFPEGEANDRTYVLKASDSIRRTDGTLYKGEFTAEWQGTFTQDGIATGAQVFFDANNTTVTKTVTKETDEGTISATYTATRRPIIILLSDGEPTYCTEDYNNVLTTTNIHGNGNTGYNNNNVQVTDTSRYGYNNNKGILGYYTILSAQYYKDRVASFYNTDAYFYTIGIGIDSTSHDSYEFSVAGDDYKRAVLNPTAANIRALTLCNEAYCLEERVVGTDAGTITNRIEYTCRMLYQLLNNSYSGSSVNISSSTQQYGLRQATTSSTPTMNNPYRASGYDYADGAYFSKDTSVTDLTAAFSNAISFTEYFPVYGFILKKNTPVDFSDTIGEGMEIKGQPVLRYGGQNFTPSSVTTRGNVTTYHYSGTYRATDGSGQSADLSGIYAEVITENGIQTVNFHIPDSVVPTYSPNLKNDGTSYFYYESLPARLIYQVGLTSEAESEIMRMNGTGQTLTYYTNAWEGGDYAYSNYTPTSKNPYYQNNTYDKSSNVKTDNTTDTKDEVWEYTDNCTATNVGVYLGNNGKLTFTTEQFETVSVELYKVDEDGDPIVTDTATFALYSDAELTHQLGEYTTDATGVVTISGLRSNRTYYLKETDAPRGYERVTQTLSFTLDVDGNVTGTTGGSVIYLNNDGKLCVKNDAALTDIPVEKKWEGELASGESYPSSVRVRLLADGEPIRTEVTLNASNNWKYTWTQLPMISSADSHEIRYTVSEINVPNGYVPKIETDENGKITITNQKQKPTSLSVLKKWVGTPKDSLIVELLKNGKTTGDYVELNDDNDWYHMWSELPSYDETGNITYSVREIVPDGYTSLVHQWTGAGDPYGQTETLVREPVSSFQTGKTYILTFTNNGTRYAIVPNSGGTGLTRTQFTNQTAVTDRMLWKAAVQSNGQVTFYNDTISKYLVLNDSNRMTVGGTSSRDYTWRIDDMGSNNLRVYGTYNSTNYYFSNLSSSGTSGTTTTTASSYRAITPYLYSYSATEDPCVKGETHYILQNSKDDITPASITLYFSKVKAENTSVYIPGVDFELYIETGNSSDELIPGTANRYGELVEDWRTDDEPEQITISQNGIYYLVETKTPKIYEPLAAPIVFEVTSNSTSRSAKVISHPTMETDTEFRIMYIENEVTKGYKMPNTGGIGTTAVYALGITLIAAAGCGIVFTQKRRKENIGI